MPQLSCETWSLAPGQRCVCAPHLPAVWLLKELEEPPKGSAVTPNIDVHQISCLWSWVVYISNRAEGRTYIKCKKCKLILKDLSGFFSLVDVKISLIQLW